MASIFFLILFVSLIVPQQVEAYLDPGTGSQIFQMILASIVVIGFFVKSFFRQIKFFLIKIFKKKKSDL